MSNARDKANIPSLNFSSTGIDDNATSTAITINSSGNVGIGESNPGNNLVVDGGANTTIRVQNDTPYYGDFQATTTGIQIRTVGSYPLILNTNQTERMRILHTGNVGIGTSSPASKLTVSDANTAFVYVEENTGDTGDTAGILFKTSASDGYYKSGMILEDDGTLYARGKLHIVQNSAANNTNATVSDAKITILNDGNVGIGTSSPTEVLHVVGDILATGGDFKSDANNYLGFSNNTFARFVINDSEKMRIDSSGNLGIGTSSPTARLSVADSKTGTEASPHLVIVGDGYTGNHWLDTSAYYIGQNSNARLLRIYSGSNEAVGVELGVGATSFGTYSDERLKKDITDLTNGLNKILALRPVNFKYKSDADDYRNRIGIIAQSIVGQVDEALDETKITADDETQYYNVRYQDLIPVLVKGIQEQQIKIEELEARITALETNQP
jgi:hypothetical protein